MTELGQESSTQAAVPRGSRSRTVASCEPPPARDGRTWLVTIPLVLIVIYAFIPILNNGFVSGWDDDQNFLDNPYFRGLGAAQVKWAWTTFWVGVYQPLAWLLFETQYVFCQLDPRGYHLTSLLFQVVNAVLLYVLTLALIVRCKTDSCLESPWTCPLSAGFATALFAVHPLRVETVAWVSCQPYLPCALFSMLSVLAYLHAFPGDSSARRAWLAGSFLLFAAALLFKAVAVTLPAVLLILDVYPLRRFPDETGRWFGPSTRTAWLEKVPFAITSVLFMGFAIAAKPDSQIPVEHHGAWLGITRAGYALWFYIWKSLLPWNIMNYYESPKELNWLAVQFGVSILATLAMTAGSFLLRRRWPGLLAVWLSYLVILAPNSGFIGIGDQIAADRYSYMAMTGWVMLAAAGFRWLGTISSRWRPGAIGIIVGGVAGLLGLAVLTRNQCRTWRDAEVLWSHVLTHSPSRGHFATAQLGNIRSAQGKYEAAAALYMESLRLNPDDHNANRVHNNLGAVLYNQGKYEEAEVHFTEALRLNPGNDKAHCNLGNILCRRENYEQAKAHFTEALRLNPGSADARIKLGTLLFTQGRQEHARAQFAEALRLNPDDDQAHNNLGSILYNQRKYEAAKAHFTEAIRLNPDNDKAHCNLGQILSYRGHYEQAEAHFSEAIRLNAGYAEAHNNWGVALHKKGNLPAAEAHYAAAIRLKPDYADAYNNWGAVLHAQKKYEAAEAQFTHAIRLNPGFADAHYNLGVSFQNKGSYQAAEAHFAEAIRHHPGNVQAHYNLGRVCSQLGNYDAAKTQFAEAIRLEPGDPKAYNASAMLMAACPEAKFRDGKGAVQFATRACELTQWNNPIILDTLAAAQAEAGDFDSAVKSQKRAIGLLTDQRRKDDYRSRLLLYQAKKPYRQPILPAARPGSSSSLK